MADQKNEAAGAAGASQSETDAQKNAVGGSIPYERFSEVVQEKNRLKAALEVAEAAQKKHAETNAGLQKALESERVGSMRLRAALSAGLPVEMADRLRGSDEAELLQDAAAVAKLIAVRETTDATERAAAGLPPSPGGSARKWDLGSMSASEIRKHADEILKGAR